MKTYVVYLQDLDGAVTAIGETDSESGLDAIAKAREAYGKYVDSGVALCVTTSACPSEYVRRVLVDPTMIRTTDEHRMYIRTMLSPENLDRCGGKREERIERIKSMLAWQALSSSHLTRRYRT